MSLLLRKLRGIVGIATTWAVSWGLIGIGVGAFRYFTAPPMIFTTLPGELISAIIPLAITGLICGAGFATALSVIERRKGILELHIFRGALWGALGSLPIPLLTGDLQLILVTAPLGAVFAGASVFIAKKSELDRLPAPSSTNTLSTHS